MQYLINIFEVPLRYSLCVCIWQSPQWLVCQINGTALLLPSIFMPCSSPIFQVFDFHLRNRTVASVAT